MVAGGLLDGKHLTTVEIYNVGKNEWRIAKPLPKPISDTAVVQFGSTFLIVGGCTTPADGQIDNCLDTIYKANLSHIS